MFLEIKIITFWYRYKNNYKIYKSLSLQVGFKGYELSPYYLRNNTGKFIFEGREYTIHHGSVVLAAITSCTNTSNPSVMLGAGKIIFNVHKIQNFILHLVIIYNFIFFLYRIISEKSY